MRPQYIPIWEYVKQFFLSPRHDHCSVFAETPLPRPFPLLGLSIAPQRSRFPPICGGPPMKSFCQRWRLVLAAAVCLTCGLFALAADEPTLTKEQIKQFLLTAKVVGSRDAKKGITHTMRLTLSDGTVTHDASFQAIDEHKRELKLATGAVELNFVDSYRYNIAAYALAELLGVDDMLPVYVERKWEGHMGSLSWWLPVKMDEVERHKQKLTAPPTERAH